MEIVESITFAPAHILGHTMTARLAHARGDHETAQREFEHALALADTSGATFVGGTIHLAMAKAAGADHDQATLAAHVREAHTRFTQFKAPIWAARARSLAERNGLTLATAN